MSVQAPEQFGRRLDAVFGALDRIGQPSRQPGTSTQWSVARQQVYRAGKGEADSSEGEEEEEAAQQPSPLLNSLLDAEDGNVQVDHQGNIVQPSLAFCQALDNEQEYDDVDAVAGTSLRSFADPADSKPNRFTEVLDDNVFDQRMRSHAMSHPSISTQMDIDTSNHTNQPKQYGLDKDTSQAASERCKSFSHICRDVKPLQASHNQPPLSGTRHGRGRSRSYVPHHVKHPEKYTCYILDEPLVVGGGDRTLTPGSSQADQEQAARAASSAAIAAQQQQQQAQLEESRDPLPAFGSGIQFRPTKKVKQQHSAHPAQRAPPAIYLTEEAEDELNADIDNAEDKQRVSQPMMVEASCMDDDLGGGKHAAVSKPRRRQYRVKSST